MRSSRSNELDSISQRSRVDELGEHFLWKLGRSLSSDDGRESFWRWLGTELGVSNDDLVKFRSSENPGYDVIRCWSDHSDDCSIRVLKNVLRDVLKRTDLVEMIDKARQSLLPPPRRICNRHCLFVCLLATLHKKKLLNGFARNFQEGLAIGQ